MKAVGVFPEEHRLALFDHPTPEIAGADELRVRILDVGICGTDREISSFAYGTSPDGMSYLILGHEALGQVTEVGSAVTRFRVGDLVVPSVRRPCASGYCLPCSDNRQDFCSTGNFRERGIKEAHGFMTEYFVEEERYLYSVPEELRDIAVLVEPLTIAEKAIAQVEHIQQRFPWSDPVAQSAFQKTVVVLGAGPIGILGAMAFVLRGYRTFVYSRAPITHQKAKLCEAFGATYISSVETDVWELAKQTGKIDVVYEALGAADISFEVMKVLGSNGVFVFTGIPPHNQAIPVHADQLMRDMVLKNQVVIGTVNAGGDAFESAICDLVGFKRHWPEAIGRIITGRYPISDFRRLLLDKTLGIKDVISLV